MKIKIEIFVKKIWTSFYNNLATLPNRAPHSSRRKNFVFFSIKSNSRNSNELSSATRYSRTSVLLFCTLCLLGVRWHPRVLKILSMHSPMYVYSFSDFSFPNSIFGSKTVCSYFSSFFLLFHDLTFNIRTYTR
jgi:hypothetical protein